MDELIPFIAAPTSLIFLGLTFMGISSVFARLGGWARLVEPYSCPADAFDTIQIHWVSFAYLGRLNYQNILRIGADSTHLYLRIALLFRAGHPPLRIPWTDVTVVPRKRTWFIQMVSIGLGPDVTLRLPAQVWDGLAHRPSALVAASA